MWCWMLESLCAVSMNCGIINAMIIGLSANSEKLRKRGELDVWINEYG